MPNPTVNPVPFGLRPTVLDGRRSQAPYRHIADYLRAGP
jgi:hypothetical protein